MHWLNKIPHVYIVYTVCFYTVFFTQEYESADRCIDRLLQMEPNNYQAKQLKELIVKKLTRGKRIHH